MSGGKVKGHQRGLWHWDPLTKLMLRRIARAPFCRGRMIHRRHCQGVREPDYGHFRTGACLFSMTCVGPIFSPRSTGGCRSKCGVLSRQYKVGGGLAAHRLERRRNNITPVGDRGSTEHDDKLGADFEHVVERDGQSGRVGGTWCSATIAAPAGASRSAVTWSVSSMTFGGRPGTKVETTPTLRMRYGVTRSNGSARPATAVLRTALAGRRDDLHGSDHLARTTGL